MRPIENICIKVFDPILCFNIVSIGTISNSSTYLSGMRNDIRPKFSMVTTSKPQYVYVDSGLFSKMIDYGFITNEMLEY